MERRLITVRGIVQGVGFRPFVYGLASRLGLQGSVKNQPGLVFIDVEGDSSSLDRFLDELKYKPPVFPHVEDVSWYSQPPSGRRDSRIEQSETDESPQSFISPDVAAYDDCLRKLFDSHDRRFQFPFGNCTNCGPRSTIIQGTP